MSKRKNIPQIIDKSEEEIAEILSIINESELPENIKQFANECIELAIWVPIQLQQKNISLHRFRTLIFGKGYGKNNAGNAKKSPQSQDKGSKACPETQQEEPSPPEAKDKELLPTHKIKKPGHGRKPHTIYKDCDEITLSSLESSPGQTCPHVCGGILRAYPPGILIRIKGLNFAKATRYTVKKGRCNLCDLVVSPTIPAEVGNEKYDPTFKAMLAIQKYYVAVPFYRQEYFQRLLGFPLPDSTQWDLIEQLANSCFPIFAELKRLAANGALIHNDDTRLKILEVIKRLKTNDLVGRRGMNTTGLISFYGSHQIALFINGTQHAGENLSDILKQRASDKHPIIQMCDGLKANIPKPMQTILCNCLGHGFRKFKELIDYFPEECITILQLFGKVFKLDEQARGMTPEARLLHHQQYSAPIMDELEQYMAQLLDEHLVEPNSELGKAIKYMQKRWSEMTKFLTILSAPIDNNIVERALKIAIRNRKAAMFYRSCYSANIGGMLTSLIYTCHLANENPFNYLTALQQNHAAVLKTPDKWLPWNYQDNLALTSQAA